MTKSNNNIVKNKRVNWASIKALSYNENSPCTKCLVNTTCSRSFIDGQGCRELAEYIKEKYEKQK